MRPAVAGCTPRLWRGTTFRPSCSVASLGGTDRVASTEPSSARLWETHWPYMKISQATPATIGQLWSTCTPRIRGLSYVDQIGEVVVDELYQKFADSLVMARLFFTVSYANLPELQSGFARQLARSVKLGTLLDPSTPVHSLLATRGCIEAWNDPGQSAGHVAIPLLSEAFVDSIPMMSQLLKELGLPLTWVQDPGTVLTRLTIGSEVGLFLVEDASTARDNQGRLIIPAQRFVSDYAVKSVFAVGGIVFGGAALVLILFSQERVESRTVRLLMPLINLLKAVLISQGSMSKVFHLAGSATRGACGASSG